ncbi:MAG: Dyp-type peroxidase [Candidatus Eremiobacteraeota bacterium]|nr:Dyp-type peroxidase [Candidatus Eremiobacteraeota bacterium]MBV8667582.1 Dyp-type peroxidase [Candidatus Eremiobacteraeota bacterium]
MSGALELDDIQSGVVRPRPTPYAASYVLIRIDDQRAGRELMRRAADAVASVARPDSPRGDMWVSCSLTFAGLRTLGVPQDSLESFVPEFQHGMASRAHVLADTGDSAPERWEKPLGTSDVHVIFTAIAPDEERLEDELLKVRNAYEQFPGISAIWRQNCYTLPTEREHFGYKDGISHPAIEGTGIAGSNPREEPLKAGEFIFGYCDEMGGFPPAPKPDALGRNGTYVVFRKLHERVAAYRRYLRDNSNDQAQEELLAAKMMGRWRSGAPLALAPEHDDLSLGADASRNNDFSYADDPIGFKTPPCSHVRRTNPRDANIAGFTRLHRMLRRGTAYGPPLPDGVLDDDGADRGIVFAFVGAHLKRQFEFVQSEWVNDSLFFGVPGEPDPVCGPNDGNGVFTIPRRPVRRKMQGLTRFVITRGGEYCFMPSLGALRWLAALRS